MVSLIEAVWSNHPNSSSFQKPMRIIFPSITPVIETDNCFQKSFYVLLILDHFWSWWTRHYWKCMIFFAKEARNLHATGPFKFNTQSKRPYERIYGKTHEQFFPNKKGDVIGKVVLFYHYEQNSWRSMRVLPSLHLLDREVWYWFTNWPIKAECFKW